MSDYVTRANGCLTIGPLVTEEMYRSIVRRIVAAGRGQIARTYEGPGAATTVVQFGDQQLFAFYDDIGIMWIEAHEASDVLLERLAEQIEQVLSQPDPWNA